MSKYVAVDDVYKAFAALDWQDLYLPIHFKEIFDEIPTVPKDWYDEQDVRNAYTDGFSEGTHRGYEDAVHNYSIVLTEMRERWISVTERLPEDGQDILAVKSWGGEVRIVAANYDRGVWYDCVFNHPAEYITHWMPLPEPPKEEEA